MTDHGYPFTEHLDVYKVAGKVFLIVTDDPDDQVITVKCEPEHARAQERGYASITPGRYLDKQVDARLRPRRGSVLARPHARRRRGPAVRGPPTGPLRVKVLQEVVTVQVGPEKVDSAEGLRGSTPVKTLFFGSWSVPWGRAHRSWTH